MKGHSDGNGRGPQNSLNKGSGAISTIPRATLITAEVEGEAWEVDSSGATAEASSSCFSIPAQFVTYPEVAGAHGRLGQMCCVYCRDGIVLLQELY